MKLYKHQQEILDKAPALHGLFWDCGMGKTLTSIKLIEKQQVAHGLVICPKSVQENWEREIMKWAEPGVAWRVVTKEQFRKNWADYGHTSLGLIIDEAHNFFGFKSKMHKNLLRFLKVNKPKAVYALTATPYLSTPYNVMCLEKIMSRDANWKDYTDRFFVARRFGPRTVNQPRPGVEPELQEIIRSCGSVKSKEECLDLPKEIFQREDFSLTSDQKRAIKALEDDPALSTPIAYWTRVHQICGGTLKDEGTYKCEKLSRVIEYAKEHKKLVVVCRYNAELEMIAKAVGSKFLINGAVKNRQEILDQFEKAQSGVLLLNAAVSEGYNVRGASTMIFYSLSFSLKDRVQMIGRISGINRGVEGVASTYIDFVVKGTIDADVYETIKNKEDFHAELYDIRRKAS